MNESVADVLLGSGLSWPDMLEMGMLMCFGICWPISIARMLRSRRSEGKSIGFVALVLVGYLLGVASKVAYANISGSALPPVTLLYAVNCFFVAADGLLCVYFRLRPGNEVIDPDRQPKVPKTTWLSSTTTDSPPSAASPARI